VQLVIQEGPTALHMTNGPIISQTVDCPAYLVGRVIGSAGATIRELQVQYKTSRVPPIHFTQHSRYVAPRSRSIKTFLKAFLGKFISQEILIL
jgi:hypothetical protein